MKNVRVSKPDTYRIKEIKAPTGYAIDTDNDSIIVTVAPTGLPPQ
ncbi:SpaA isopeptide-forming pilin-related protein [Arthrobacter sp. GMC3]